MFQLLIPYLEDLETKLYQYNTRLTGNKAGQQFIKNQEEHNRNAVNLAQYIRYIKYRKSLLEEQQQDGSSILTSIKDIKDRLQILVGEITSGNTNKALKNELAEILNYLYKNQKYK